MVIKASSAKQIDALLADLHAGAPLKRDSAIARLTVLGARAVEPLLNLLGSTASPLARTAALRALEAIADPRALQPVLNAIDDDDGGVALAALEAARVFLRSAQGAAVVDRLTAVALDRHRDETLRLAALGSLAELEATTIAPLMRALRADPNEAIRAAASSGAIESQPEGPDPVVEVTRAAEDGVVDSPAALRQAIVQARATVPLSVLLRLVERSREREATEPPRRRGEWLALRGAAHMALAHRGSRLAVYDLRESLESATTPLPADFIAALSALGDASCLEAIATAYARPSRTADDWWRQRLAESFRAIVAREGITRRQAVMKKIGKRWPEALAELLH